jgi:hypothetical protein
VKNYYVLNAVNTNAFAAYLIFVKNVFCQIKNYFLINAQNFWSKELGTIPVEKKIFQKKNL